MAASLMGGGFVVTWGNLDGKDGDSWGVYGQRFDVSGAKVGPEIQVNAYTSSDQYSPSVASLTSGGFVVTWQSAGQEEGVPGSYCGIYGQRFNAIGGKVGPEFLVNTYTTGHQYYSSVAGLTGGGFVVTWDSANQDGDSQGIYRQRFDAGGVKAGDELQVNTYTTSNQHLSSIAGLTNGGFVVAWHSDSQDGNYTGIYERRYNSTGGKLGNEIQVNTYTANDQRNPSVTGLNDGGFVITWHSFGQDGNDYGIYGQHYNSNGGTVGSEFKINTYTVGDQDDPSVTSLTNGGFVVTWSDGSGRDGSGSSSGVYGRISAPCIETNTLTITEGGSVVLTTALLNAVDWSGLPDSLLNFTVTNIQHGFFDNPSNPGVKITSFTLQDIKNNQTRFTHDGSESAPAYDVKVSNGGIESSYQNATITFIPNMQEQEPPIIIILVGAGAALLCTLSATVVIAGILMLTKEKKKNEKNIAEIVELKRKDKENKKPITLDSHNQLVIGEHKKEIVIPYKEIKLKKSLGEGAFGEVFRAKWGNHAVVAYKSLKIKEMEPKDFQREVTTMSYSSHPCIAQIYGIVLERDELKHLKRLGIVMEYMEQGSLQNLLLNRKKSLSWKARWQISLDITSGLSKLHDKDIMHRDLKSPNVLIHRKEAQLRAKLTDFGCSKKVTENKQDTSNNIGTSKWIAPEFYTALRPKYKTACDVYSLGVIFWEIATRKVPFASIGANDKMIPIWVSGRGTPEEVASVQLEIPRDCPPAYAALIKICRNVKAPEQRLTANETIKFLNKNKEKIVNSNVKNSHIFFKPNKGNDPKKPLLSNKGKSEQNNKQRNKLSTEKMEEIRTRIARYHSIEEYRGKETGPYATKAALEFALQLFQAKEQERLNSKRLAL